MAGGTPGGVTGNTLPSVAALLRRPTMKVRHELLQGLRAAGYDDILPAHLGVFQYPGPDGQRPGVLAARTHASKQAMNHLLHQLENAGYLVREPHPADRRIRVVRLTERGWAASEQMGRIVARLERVWCAELGREHYRQVQRALLRLDDLLDRADGVRTLS
jgi:DNA-binding MarR family transcriptional regulator